MDYKDLANDVSLQCNNMRSIALIVEGYEFEDLWNKSTKEQRTEVCKYIETCNKHKVKEWMYSHPTIKAEDWSFVRLIARAKILRIKNYSRLSRADLVQAIMEKES